MDLSVGRLASGGGGRCLRLAALAALAILAGLAGLVLFDPFLTAEGLSKSAVKAVQLGVEI